MLYNTTPAVNNMVSAFHNSLRGLLSSYVLCPQKPKQRDRRTRWELLAVPITLIVVVVSQMFAYAQLIKVYALNMCGSLYIDYTSIKLLKKQRLQSPTCRGSLGFLG